MNEQLLIKPSTLETLTLLWWHYFITEIFLYQANCAQTLMTAELRPRQMHKLRVCGSGRIQEQILIKIPWHGRIQILFLIRLHLFGCLDIRANVLRDQRRLVPFQPVSHHVAFTLLETRRIQCAPSDRQKWPMVGTGSSPSPAAFLCTPARSRQSPPAGKKHWRCIGSSGLQRYGFRVGMASFSLFYIISFMHLHMFICMKIFKEKSSFINALKYISNTELYIKRVSNKKITQLGIQSIRSKEH